MYDSTTYLLCENCGEFVVECEAIAHENHCEKSTRKKQKPYSFFFHYNKPLSQQRGKNVLSLHFRDTCHFVESLSCNVPIATRNRKTQPRCVMSGKATAIEIRDVAGVPHAVIH